MTKCSIEGCGRPKHAAGLCGMHRRRQTRNKPMNDPVQIKMTGEYNGQTKLNIDAVKDIKSSVDSKKVLAVKYNVSVRAIDSIKTGRTWKWL